MGLPRPGAKRGSVTIARAPFRVRLASSPVDVAAAQALRHLCFVEARGLERREGGLDRDGHDDLSEHLLVEAEGRLVACLRMRRFDVGDSLLDGYAATFHDLAPLAHKRGVTAEVGRFCVRPDTRNAAGAVTGAWRGLAAWAEARKVATLFGCATFEGTDPTPCRDAFALLARDHQHADAGIASKPARGTIPLDDGGPLQDRRAALLQMPTLPRSYLAMGARTGSHAAIDRDLRTLHVLVVLDRTMIPPARMRSLRAIVAERPGVG